MHAMAELMRERHHVAWLALIVDQHIRMRRRRSRMRKCPRRLTRTHRRVDPALAEEARGDVRHLRRECAVGGKYGVLGFVPRHATRRYLRQRGVTVPMRQALFAEPSGLERVIAMRQSRIS